MERLSSIYYPMLVAESDAGDATALWEEFQKLPVRFRDILTSLELPRVLVRIQRDYALDDAAIAQISRLLLWLFFQKLTWEEFSVRVESVLLAAQGNGQQTNELLAQIKREILNMNPTQYEDAENGDLQSDQPQPTVNPKNIRYLPILKALSQYPELHYQRITEEKISVKGEREPVAPSIRNWLRVYRDEVGVGQHSSVERGQFLFQGTNTKKLSTAERETLALLVKSLDEEEPLAVDVQQKVILFQISAPQAPVKTAGAPESLPVTNPASSNQNLTPRPTPPRLRFEMNVDQPEAAASGSNVADDQLSFSSGQRLQGEQDAWESAQKMGEE